MPPILIFQAYSPMVSGGSSAGGHAVPRPGHSSRDRIHLIKNAGPFHRFRASCDFSEAAQYLHVSRTCDMLTALWDLLAANLAATVVAACHAIALLGAALLLLFWSPPVRPPPQADNMEDRTPAGGSEGGQHR